MLPSVPSADPASGSRSRRFHRPILISPPIFNLSPLSFSSPIPPSPFNHFQPSPSFQLCPKVNFRELPSGARITGLLLVNPLVSTPSFSRGYPYLSGQHPRLLQSVERSVLGRQNPRGSIVRWVADSTPTNGREAFRVEDRKFWYWYLDFRSRAPRFYSLRTSKSFRFFTLASGMLVIIVLVNLRLSSRLDLD